MLNRVPDTNAYLAVRLSKNVAPAVVWLTASPTQELTMGTCRFVDAGLGDWLGFYDWLRSSDGAVIGVRLWLDEPNGHITDIERCLGVQWSPDSRSLRVFFTSEIQFSESLSDDQDFGGNRLFIGQGSFVLTFNTPSTVVFEN